MDKVKSSMGKIGKYLREISVVVIGVAITLSASYWITSRSEKKDLALYLEAIKMELEENIRALNVINQHVIQPAVKYSVYLSSQDKKALNADSLRYYMYETVNKATSITIKTNAFEMFKSSGKMRLVDQKELLLSIWDTYTILGREKQIFDQMAEMKTEEVKKYLFQYSNRPSDADLLNNPPLWEIYVNMPLSYVQEESYKRAIASLTETLSKFK